MRVLRVFILIVLCLLTAAGSLLFMHYYGDERAYYAGIAALALNLLLLIPLYRMSVKPMRSLSNGLNLLRGQDFSSRLAPVGQYEADRIVDMFNRMMGVLKDERLHVREQNHFLDLLIGVSPMGILILKDNDVIDTCNGAAASFLGYESAEKLCGMPLKDCNSQLGNILARLGSNEVVTARLNTSMIYRCSRLSFMDKGYSHPFILIERLTEEVMKAEKKSYEKVIRVIAHEVNNTMGGIKILLDTVNGVMDDDGLDPAIGEVIDVCRQRCDTMSEFITNFANVVKIPDVNLRRTNLNNVVEEERVLLESMCVKHDISLKLNLHDGPIDVNLDSVLFEQVLINIVKNAIESIGSNGEVSITTSSNPSSIVIADNGAGILPETADKLFSPFFSTKTDGQGIGLMFISEVLHKHGCKFSLETGTDGITRFEIIF